MRSSFASLPELVSRYAKEMPGNSALVCPGRSVSWAELDEMVGRVTVALDEADASKGTRVAVHMEDPVAFIVMLVAVLRMRAILVPLPTDLAAESLRSIVSDCKPVLIVADEHRASLEQECMGRPVVPYSALSGARGRAVDARAPMADDTATILYSSGTTSRPKGAVHTQGARFDSQQRFIGRFALNRRTVTLVATPLYTSMTWASLLPTLAAGGTSVVMPRFNAEQFWETAAQHSAKLALLVPTQYAMLLESEPKRRGFDQLECPIVGGAKADRNLIERLMTATRGRLIEQLGSTETEAIACLPSNAPREKWGSAGLPLEGVKIRIVGAGDREVPAGEPGELAVHSTSLMTGYYGMDSDKAAFWKDPVGGLRYYRMGDVGMRDGDGYLWVHGRSNDLIIAAGHNVYPSDIEEVLLRHPVVRRAAVVGASSKVLGAVPIAFVELSASGAATESELCSWLNARLSDKQRVYRVQLIESMPVNPSGKIVKAALRELVHAAR